jgi:hypothetical protein
MELICLGTVWGPTTWEIWEPPPPQTNLMLLAPSDYLFGSLKNHWLASDMQLTLIRSKLSPPSYKHLTLISCTAG